MTFNSNSETPAEQASASPSDSDSTSCPESTADTESDSPDSTIDAVRAHLDDHIIALFGDPPTTPCTHDTGHTIREGDPVALAVSYTEENGVAETHAIHCRQCALPSSEELPYGDWACFVTGTAAPNDWVEGGGDCLVLDDVTIQSIQPIPDN